jgi:hypothetical protein
MYAEASSRNGAEGVLDVGPPACAPLISVKLDARDGAEGGGGLRCEATGLHPQQ